MGARLILTVLLLQGMVLGATAMPLCAEELANSAVAAELASLHTRLESMESQMQSVIASGGGGDCACLPTCCDCGWYVGAGAYFVVPYWTSNPALARSQAVGTVTETEQIDFDYGMTVAPLFWVGYRGESCLGFEARAWWLDDEERIDLTNPGDVAIDSAAPLGAQNLSTTAGDVLVFESSLEIEVIDLLGTYQTQLGMATFDLGAGIRYARIEQEYRHSEDPAADDLVDAIDSEHSFEGIGPTLALRARAPATDRLSLLADLRYSVLFGDFDQTATQVVNNVVASELRYSSDDFLSIGELELGAEYLLPRGRCDFFLDAAVVAQVWLGAGNSANNDGIIVLVDPEVADKNADLALFGFRLGGGVRY